MRRQLVRPLQHLRAASHKPKSRGGRAGARVCSTQPVDRGKKRSRDGSIRPMIKEFQRLGKSRLSFFNAMAAGLGACAYSGGLTVAAPALVGTYLLACSSGSVNQLQETWEDSQMARTKLSRPLVTGRLSQTTARLYSAATVAAGVGTLYTFCGPASVVVGISTMALYNGAYTPLKKRTIYNTELGAVVGALPPLIGCAAALHTQAPDLDSCSILLQMCTDPAALALFSFLYMWQMPHFMAICVRNRSDYMAGNFEMLSKYDAHGYFCARKAVAYSAGLVILPPLMAYTGVTTWMYAVDGTALALGFLGMNYRWFRSDDRHRATGQVFKYGLFMLPASLALMALHSGRWTYEKGNAMRSHFAWLQDRGIEGCPEAFIASSKVARQSSEKIDKPCKWSKTNIQLKAGEEGFDGLASQASDWAQAPETSVLEPST